MVESSENESEVSDLRNKVMSMQITKMLQISRVAYLKNTPSWRKKNKYDSVRDTQYSWICSVICKNKRHLSSSKGVTQGMLQSFRRVTCLVNFSQLSDSIPLRVTKNSPKLGAAVVTWSHLVDYSCDKGTQIPSSDNHEEVALLVFISKSVKERKHRIYWKFCSQ